MMLCLSLLNHIITSHKGDGYANMSGENSAVAFHKINTGPEGWWCGTCSFKLRYSNGSNHQSRSYLIKMNGEALDTIKFDKTTSWSTWEYTKSITSYNCLGNNDGKTYNTVSVEIQNDGGKGYIYLDGLDFKLGTDDDEEEDEGKTTPEVSRHNTRCDNCATYPSRSTLHLTLYTLNSFIR